MNAGSIIKKAGEMFSVQPEHIIKASRFRARSVVKARSAVIYALRSNGMPWYDIRDSLGYSDHTGAVLLYEKTCQRIEQDSEFAEMVRQIREAA